MVVSLYPEISAQWLQEKNGDYSLTEMKCWFGISVWWRCEKGHEWKARPASRSGGTGCPYCTTGKVLKGFNDLATIEPRVAAQWHPTLNGLLTPDKVVFGSHKYGWWLCAEGHVWRARIE